jgi:hypothetical protein
MGRCRSLGRWQRCGPGRSGQGHGASSLQVPQDTRESVLRYVAEGICGARSHPLRSAASALPGVHAHLAGVVALASRRPRPAQSVVVRDVRSVAPQGASTDATRTMNGEEPRMGSVLDPRAVLLLINSALTQY